MKVLFYILPLFFSTLAICAKAQQATVKTMYVPFAGSNVLKDVQDTYGAQVFSLEAPEPDGEPDAAQLNIAKKTSARMFPHLPGNTAAKGASAMQPQITTAFVADSFPGIPPDNYLAVGRQQQGIAVMNSSVAIHNTMTGQYLQRKSLASFSAPVGLNNSPSNQNNYRYDPKVVYDPAADRFICVMLNGVNQYNYIVVGFSKTSDPTGGWNWYKFYGDYGNDSTWFDYPAIALTNNDIFITGNKLGYNTSFQLGFKRSVIYQIRKKNGYDSATLTMQLWDNINYGGRPVRNLFPADGGSGLKGPAQYFVNVRNMDVQNDTVFLIKIPDTAGSASTSLTVTAMVANLSYGMPPNGRQPGTFKTLATNDGRVLGAYVEGQEIQFVSASVVPATGASGIYHGIISGINGTPAVQARMLTIDSLDYGYPNISYGGDVGGKNTSLITFNYTGPGTNPGLGAILWDGSDYSDLLKVKSGDSYINQLTDTVQRWGDYTGSQPEWNTPGSVWIVGIYGRSDNRYGNWMAKLRNPSYTAVPATPAFHQNAIAYPNPAYNFIRIGFELKSEALLHFSITDAAGRQVAELLDAQCEPGKNELEFNTAPLAAGTYYLNASDAALKLSFSKAFVRR